MLEVTKYPNGYTEAKGCPACNDAPFLFFDDEKWTIDFDDGWGTPPLVNFCPMCGLKLPDRAGLAIYDVKAKSWKE